VRVRVQHAGARRPGEQEAYEQVGVVVALLLRAVRDHRGQRRGALQPLGDQHRPADRHHVRHDDLRVVAERRRERALGLRLELVVQLLLDPGLQLLDERLDLDAGHHRPDRPGEAGQLAQVGAQRVAGAGVLHLDGDVAPVVPAAPVDLADRRGGGRPAVQPDEPLAPVAAEVALERVTHELGGHRRGGVLQPGELVAVGPDQLVGERGLEHGHRLPELHRPALELAERAEQLFGGALLDLQHHGLGRLAAETLAEPDRVAPGEAERQRGQACGARGGLPGELGHGPSVTVGPNRGGMPAAWPQAVGGFGSGA
jgi:hypothetical protein